jgi:hypothetical protein
MTKKKKLAKAVLYVYVSVTVIGLIVAPFFEPRILIFYGVIAAFIVLMWALAVVDPS